MNKEKTAMQMLIEKLDKRYDSLKESNNPYHHNTRGILTIIIHEAKSLLAKEQEQIEQAFEGGYGEGVFRGNLIIDADDGVTPDKYYKSKYGGEDVDR